MKDVHCIAHNKLRGKQKLQYELKVFEILHGRCFNNSILHIQVFDALVILISFVIDLVFIEGVMSMEISNYVIVLTFLLPWRIIRILNSKSNICYLIKSEWRI